MNQHRDEPVLTQADARQYFQDAVQSAISNQNFSVSDESAIYVVNMLLAFLRTERLFDSTAEGIMMKPLALIYGEALQARTESDRSLTMQRLGDLALFISGLYANSLNRSLVDVDYYMAMGGNAYSYMADCSKIAQRQESMRQVFDELSSRFASFVDILAEVGEDSGLQGNTDIMRLYELWQCTGSERLARKLRDHGIHPVRTNRVRH